MKFYQNFNPLVLTFWRGWGLSLGSFLIFYALGKFSLAVSLEFLFWIGLSQVFGLFIGRAAFIKAHEFFRVGQLSFMMLSIPLIILLLSPFVLGEVISPQKILGASIMMAGLAWFIQEQRRMRRLHKK